MSLKRKIFLGSILLILILVLLNRQLITSIYSIAISHISSPDLSYVKKEMWSYNGGFKVGKGDFVEFEKSGLFKLQQDTIYYNGEPRAIIKRLNKHFYEMTVSSLDGKQTGTYINTEEHLQ
jgi:hypothetical protein